VPVQVKRLPCAFLRFMQDRYMAQTLTKKQISSLESSLEFEWLGGSSAYSLTRGIYRGQYYGCKTVDRWTISVQSRLKY